MSLPVLAQGTATGTIKGQVLDDTGAYVPASDVTITGPAKFSRTLQSDATGKFSVPGLAPGNYVIKATRRGFAVSSTPVAVAAGKVSTLNVALKVEASKQEVTVQGEAVGTVSVEASANASQLVLKQTEIDALPDDPDDLAADLQALAGPSAGPNGGQIYIDGFTGGQLPPKSSIREIRINQNPFSAEYDRLGFGRIEILTKPGSDRLRGQVFFSDSDALLNSRNPYSSNKPDFSSRMFSGNVGGPLNKKTSYFVDFERRDIRDNALINATLLNASLLPYQLQESVLTPNARTEFSGRVDYALNASNTLVMRFVDEQSHADTAGIGSFTLATRAYKTQSVERGGYITETAVLNPKTINETRIRFLHEVSNQDGNNSIPSINVSSAFNTGGSGVGNAWDTQNNLEIQNYTSVSLSRHAMKFGVRVRSNHQSNNSPGNFNGSYTFSGSVGPYLDANNNPIAPCNGSLTSTSCQQLTSLQQYQRTLLFQSLGYSPAAIQALGGMPNQYTVVAGDPAIRVSQTDAGLFYQDDWRARQNLTVSVGLRWETQTNISNKSDFAPRLAMAWSPDSKGTKPGKTVIRVGYGLFYDRFPQGEVLNSLRYNGITEQSYILQYPLFYSPTAVPSLSSLTLQSTAHDQIASNLHAPYIGQGVAGVERQLPRNTTLAVNFMDSHGVHELLVRNINAPLPGTYVYGVANSGVYPYGQSAGVINQFESDGTMNQKQMVINVNSRMSSNFSLFGYYSLNSAKSNTDGSGNNPMNAYNLAQDYGRAQFSVRNRAFIGGSIATARKYGNLRFSPFITMRSGTPFDITTGKDLNGDSYFDDRPSFAPAGSCPSTNPDIKCTKYGNFLLTPTLGTAPIPRNYATGPANFTINLRMSRTWGFGEARTSAAGGTSDGGGRGGRGGGPGGPGGFGGGGMRGGGGRGGPGGGDGTTNQRYNLTLSISARNLFNTVNPSNPVGNLSSPSFGESLSVAGGMGGFGSSADNRRIDMQIRFAF
jgi:hypothetical protein